MRNNIKEFLKKSVPGVIIVAMLVIPFPSLVIEVLFFLEMAFSVGLFICSLFRNRKSLSYFVVLFCMFALMVNISLTRIALTGFESERQVPVTEFFAGVLGGNSIVIGFAIAMILVIVQIILVSKTCQEVEVATRFSLDSMSQKLFDVDNNLSAGRVTASEAENRKEVIRADVDYFSSLDGSAKFLRGTEKATVLVILVNLLGGLLINMVRLSLSISVSLAAAAKITTGNIILFILPSLVVIFGLGISVKGYKNI